MHMFVCVCSSLQSSVEWGREQERLTAVFFPRDKFPTTTLPGSAGTGEPKDKIAICLGE